MRVYSYINGKWKLCLKQIRITLSTKNAPKRSGFYDVSTVKLLTFNILSIQLNFFDMQFYRNLVFIFIALILKSWYLCFEVVMSWSVHQKLIFHKNRKELFLSSIHSLFFPFLSLTILSEIPLHHLWVGSYSVPNLRWIQWKDVVICQVKYDSQDLIKFENDFKTIKPICNLSQEILSDFKLVLYMLHFLVSDMIIRYLEWATLIV